MIKYIDEYPIQNKQVLLKVDFNVALNPDYTISDDAKIKQTLPTLKLLLGNKNRLIITSHLGRPQNHDEKFSLAKIIEKLKKYFPEYKINLVADFTQDASQIKNQAQNEILVLENIRFHKEEKENDEEFGKLLASLAEVFVNDAFAVSHRAHASVVGPTKYIPSYAGLLLKKEVQALGQAIKTPKRPLVYIMGGVKISTKINLIEKLIKIADTIIIGGALANNFLAAQGREVGKSFFESDQVAKAKELIELAKSKGKEIVLPQDMIVGDMANAKIPGKEKNIQEISKEDNILDIGQKTQKNFSQIIKKAKTIIWNGPVGFFENPQYKAGTDSVYEAIVENNQAISLLGGGDTLAALSNQNELKKIAHISTGGGAMLEFIENGSLPGIDALDI